MDDCQIIESVHLGALKWFLNVSFRTPKLMAYGETGRFPIFINAKMRSIRYWLKILKMDKDRLPYKVYTMLFNRTEDYNTWTSKVKHTLVEYGFEYVWNDQHVPNETVFLSSLRENMIDRFLWILK